MVVAIPGSCCKAALSARVKRSSITGPLVVESVVADWNVKEGAVRLGVPRSVNRLIMTLEEMTVSENVSIRGSEPERLSSNPINCGLCVSLVKFET